ncbi:type A2 lantipeptide [Actinacidiphila acidipaludis]|uniref:Type A2 lantipeptide n=1 Tax=Actinacidiphila acidipaludis TaxID=2873382 RepID=A0ABS7PZS8_9ACTN|nr:type A2 lantipeptide [Streptomyces acidipaludis]MBY8876386.1 type A2 lantipeptide [Streptomyces acidipaludis]
MRNTPQVETREISDTELDGVSGGISISGGAQIDGLDTLVGSATSALPSLPVGEVVGLVTGAAGTLTGVTGIAGI